MQGGVKEDSQASFQHVTHTIFMNVLQKLKGNNVCHRSFSGMLTELATHSAQSYTLHLPKLTNSVLETEAELELAVPNLVLCSSFNFH